MTIPELAKEQRIESFIKTRLKEVGDGALFTKRELAEFCLNEIDFAMDMTESFSKKDVEEQLAQ